MALLHDIQTSLLDEDAKIGPILLKLRFLADRLESNVLEDWVRFEAEGYPDRNTVPEYRRTSISYRGTFVNGIQKLNDISIPSHLVETYASAAWTSYGLSDPLPMIEDMIQLSGSNGSFSLDVSDLKLLLDRKIYEQFTLLELTGRIDIGAFARILSVVRSRLLDFVLELERKVPVSSTIIVGKEIKITQIDTETVSHITQNFFNAPVQNITTSGTASPVNISVVQGDVASLESALSLLGLSGEDAEELSKIASTEKPEDSKATFGSKAAGWITSRLSKGADGVLKIGGKVLEDDIAKLFRQFYDNI